MATPDSIEINGNTYKKLGNIKGAGWTTGSGAPTTNGIIEGDLYLDKNSGKVYLWSNNSWTEHGNIKGPQGPKGDRGIQGPSGSAVGTGTLDLSSSSNGIKFNTSSYYVTNMEAGSVSLSLGANAGNEASKNVSFHGGSKGSGKWRIVAQADGVLSDNVSIGITNVSDSGFTIWVKNVISASKRTLTLYYVAVKYY